MQNMEELTVGDRGRKPTRNKSGRSISRAGQILCMEEYLYIIVENLAMSKDIVGNLERRKMSKRQPTTTTILKKNFLLQQMVSY
jgi:hypothetical protein